MANILIIDDELALRRLIRDILEQTGHEVTSAANGAIGIQLFRESSYDLVITDIIMPGREGIETIVEMRELRPDQKIIAISGGGRTGNTEFLAIAQKVGAEHILAKPFSIKELRLAVAACLEHPLNP